MITYALRNRFENGMFAGPGDVNGCKWCADELYERLSGLPDYGDKRRSE